MHRSIARGVLALALGLAALAPHAWAVADTYPSRPVTIIAQLAAGTGLDTVARLYGDRLAQNLGQPMVIENRPGGAGHAATDGILKAPADGYTLAVVTSSVMAIRPTMFKKLPYDPLKDFVPVSLYLKSPFILVVNPALPIQSVPELIAYIKQRPGQISFSSPSIGGAPHLVGEYLKQRYGIEMAHIPYRNSPQAIADVAAGHVPLTFAEAGASLPLIKDGKLRALAVTSTTRLGSLPDVPSLAEASGVPDFEAVSWHTLIIRAAAPREVVSRLHGEMSRIMAAPDMKRTIENLGMLPQDPPSIEETQRYIKAELDKWGTLVRSLGLEGSQ
jgi:tripartite-type tricarboxylate transporter receptor subunit TctC